MRWLLVFHLFGVILWVGSLLLIASLLAAVSDEVGVAKERFILVANRLFSGGSNSGGAVAIAFGVLLMIADPAVIRHGWIYAKIGLVIVLLGAHIHLQRRIVALTDNPSSVTRREFRVMHGLASVLLLAILALAVFKPF